MVNFWSTVIDKYYIYATFGRGYSEVGPNSPAKMTTDLDIEGSNYF